MREDLEATGQIARLDKTIGADGKADNFPEEAHATTNTHHDVRTAIGGLRRRRRLWNRGISPLLASRNGVVGRLVIPKIPLHDCKTDALRE